ncbi:hypothetical protein L1987_43216 [Smallanthus sonchifolius]|uniref:Uncharacterized protein n=1 Tax=Smallanthus sonchifolius TaxID=185202 RepID=A0ACB9GLR9_9ASTR|nr:hypothetical protein L1987_43216 [Smallanthus sonchifolius]
MNLLIEKENGKRMKDNTTSLRRNKDKKGNAAYQQVKPSSHATNHSIDNDEILDDDISYKATGGAVLQIVIDFYQRV